MSNERIENKRSFFQALTETVFVARQDVMKCLRIRAYATVTDSLQEPQKMGVTDAVLVERNMGPESARIAAKLGCRKHARAWYNCNRRAGV